jgi:choline kinase
MMTDELNAIILAAGQGRRLGKQFWRKPKSLIEINSRTLLERIVLGLSNLDVKIIKIITGFEINQIEAEITRFSTKIKSDVQLVENRKFNKFGSFYSLYLALQNISANGVWIFDSDIIFEEDLFAKIKSYHSLSSTLCCTELTDNPDKVIALIDNERVVKFGKLSSITSLNYGKSLEYIGVLYLDSHAISFLKELDSTYFEHEYEDVLNRFLDQINVAVMNLGKLKWNEIDTIEDYRNVLEKWQ